MYTATLPFNMSLLMTSSSNRYIREFSHDSIIHIISGLCCCTTIVRTSSLFLNDKNSREVLRKDASSLKECTKHSWHDIKERY